MTVSITEHVTKSKRHTTFYQAAGPEDGPLLIFVHGWPELSISWRHQLPALAAIGFIANNQDTYSGRLSFIRYGLVLLFIF